jgi:hypothetical protein
MRCDTKNLIFVVRSCCSFHVHTFHKILVLAQAASKVVTPLPNFHSMLTFFSLKRRSTPDSRENINPEKKRRKTGNVPVLTSDGTYRMEMGATLRSVLTHPLCLPLFYVMHDMKHDDENNANLPFHKLLVENATLVPADTKHLFNHVLLNALGTNKIWNLADSVLFWIPWEVTITQRIVKRCNQLNDNGSISFFATREVLVAINEDDVKGQTRFLFTDMKISTQNTENEFTPLNVIEVGLDGSQWWKTFDQCVRYLDGMCDPEEGQAVVFTRPILMSVITIDSDMSADGVFVAKIAVFFCHPPRRDDNKLVQQRVALLWHSVSTSWDEASINFGKVLEVTAHFQQWVKRPRDYADTFGYEYFSSNCCRLGDRVCD